MGYQIEVQGLHYSIHNKKILSELDFSIGAGNFTALLGENGSGKSTLLDLLMGFRIPKQGKILIDGIGPETDNLVLKANTIYLSEKMEVPVYWKIGDYLDFHRNFYPGYSLELEAHYLQEYRIQRETSFRSLSTGENKRAQIVAALSSQPQLLLVDEITAVLDIVGRQLFMSHLAELGKKGCTLIMATNILENIDRYATHLLLLNHGRISYFGEISQFSKSSPQFIDNVAERLRAA